VAADGTDVTIFALGPLVSEALWARELAAATGVSVRVVNMSSIRPVDAAGVARLAASSGRVITVEEHTLHGGVGSLVAEIVAEGGLRVRMTRLGIPEGEFAKAGPRAQIRRHYGIDARGIHTAVLRITGGEV
jgi:transketolase